MGKNNHLYHRSHHHFETTSDSNSTSTTNSTDNSTSTTDTSSSSDDSSDTTMILALVFGFIGLILLIVLLVWLYLKWKQKKIIKDYTMNPESFLAPQKLSIGQKYKLGKWSISKDPKHQISDFSFKSMSTVLGSYLQLNFKQQEGSFQSIISEIPVDQSKEISYFEIEIENMPKNETSIVIGFATETDYVKTFSPGEYPNSVGFKSSIDKCEAFLNNKAMATFEFSVKFGETFGIGVRGKDGRVWLSHNGIFLNPPAPSERLISEKERKKKEAEFARMEPETAKELKDKEEALEQEAKKKKITYNVGKKKFFPVIGTDGTCTLNLNIGGMPFRLFQKEVATGLL